MGRVHLADARWLDVNPAFCRMLGRSCSELLAMSWREMTHPDDIAQSLAISKAIMQGKFEKTTLEKRYLHKQGHHVWVRLNVSLVCDASGTPDYALAIIEDIRDRKALEESLLQREAQLEHEQVRLQAIIDTIPTGLIMLDENGAFVIENAEWKRIWGGNAIVNGVLDYDAYKGFRPDTGERISIDEWPCAMSLKQGIQTRGVILDIERFNGTRGTIVVSSAPIRDKTGRIIAAVAANMDITELRQAQAKLLETDKRKDEFLAMLAHELRNPLAPISTAAEMLKMISQSDSKVSKASEVISRQAKHLTALVNDLLDVSRVTKGLVDLDKELVNFQSVIDSAIEQSSPLMHAKHLELRCQGNHGHAQVMGDRNRLVQVVSNLLNNAAKFTPQHGRITLSTHVQDDRVFVEIEDDGIGIAADLLPEIFDLFTQAERTLDRTQGGLGIGLALVKTIVGLHGGEISAYSAGLNTGARFTVMLPRQCVPSAASFANA